MTPLSVIILSKNESIYIERCIRSVSWADEIVVLDSGSTDDTVAIATALGAKVYKQDWLGYSAQRNKGISLAVNDWVFYLDCDEIVTPELSRSLQQAMESDPEPEDGFAVDRRGDFLGVLLANKSRPSKVKTFIRVFNRKHSHYDPKMSVHEVVIVPGKSMLLDGVLLHWRGYVMDEYIPVFNKYATMEAQVLSDEGVKASSALIFGRPILRFFWTYFWKGGYKQGTRGLIHAMLKATSEFIRYAKLWELQNVEKTVHPPREVYEAPALEKLDEGVV